MGINEFKDKHLGKQVEYHSFGGGSYAQCVDLVNAYINQVLDTQTKDYTEIIGTNAKDFATKYDPEDFEYIANTPTGVPKEGDIVIWNGKVGGGVGHVAIFLEGDVNSFRSLDQNWSQKERVTLETHNYNNVLGWLRPKERAQMATITQKELDEIRLRRDELYNENQKLREEKINLTDDVRVANERCERLIKELEIENNEDLKTAEQLLDAQKALDPLKATIAHCRGILGLSDTVSDEDLIFALQELKDAKVKHTKPPVLFRVGKYGVIKIMTNGKKDNWFIEAVKRNPATAIQFFGVLVLIVNLFLAYKLTPLVQGLDAVVERVDAMEKALNETAEKANEITTVKANIEFIREDVVEIKESVQRIEDALFIIPR